MRAFILEGDAASETTDLGAVRAAIAAKKTIWIDLEAEAPEVDALLEGPLGLHPLTVEDIWSDSPSPKADEFPSYLYVCAHTVKREKGDLLTCEVDLVIGANYVVTHDATGTVAAALRDDLKRSPRLLVRGAPW